MERFQQTPGILEFAHFSAPTIYLLHP